jgi:hypothetical protein
MNATKEPLHHNVMHNRQGTKLNRKERIVVGRTKKTNPSIHK